MQIKSSDGKTITIGEDSAKGRLPLSIVLCIPGNQFSSVFNRCLLSTVDFFYSNNIKYSYSNQYSSVVHFARSMCLGADLRRGIHQKPFDGKVQYTHLLWIDSDSVWTPQNLVDLLGRNVDVVAGHYLLHDQSGYATVSLKDWDLDYYKKNGKFKYLTDDDIKRETEKDKNALIETAYTGFGFLLMKKGVMESLDYPWFISMALDAGDEVADITSEDVSCCLRLREKGYKVWVDPKVRIGHEKKVVL